MAIGLGAAERVVVDIPEGCVVADRGLLLEIVTDLLAYALEHAPERSTVTICADSDKSGLRLWISEHGFGIDPADRTAIVDRFDRAAARPHGGPGLGLHLANRQLEEPRPRRRSSASAA